MMMTRSAETRADDDRRVCPDLPDPARERGARLNLPYAGALVPREAHGLMQAGARLVDVRTQAELYWVGRVPGALPVEWNGYPGGQRNPLFLEQLADLVERDEPVMFICRSGGRSHDAAIVDSMRKRVIELEYGKVVRDQSRGVYGQAY